MLVTLARSCRNWSARWLTAAFWMAGMSEHLKAIREHEDCAIIYEDAAATESSDAERVIN